jgi:signal transduction histidine kinase
MRILLLHKAGANIDLVRLRYFNKISFYKIFRKKSAATQLNGANSIKMNTKKLFFIISLALFFISFAAAAQDRVHIDSINALEFQNLFLSPDSIIKMYQKNIENAEKIDYKKGLAKGYTRLGLAFGYQGNFKEATKLSFKAINLYEELKMYDEVAVMYAGMGYAIKYSDYEKGLYYMQKGKAVAENNNLQNELKDIYNNYGVLKEINNELDSALYYYNKGLDIKIAQKNTFDIPYSLSNIAGVYGLQKKYEDAKTLYREAIKARIALNDSIGLAENYTQIGEVYQAEKKYLEAITFIKKSLPISIAKEYKNLTQYNYKLLSDIYKKLNNTEDALAYYEKFIVVKDSIQSESVQKEISKLTIEFETEKKERDLAITRADLAEKELEVKEKNTLIYGAFGLALILGLLGYLFYNQQKLKNHQLIKEGQLKTALSKIETQNKLQEQRLRISRDLHDNIGAQLTFIISSIDNLKFGFTDMGEKLAHKLTGISKFTNQTIYELRDTIWAMNKENITFEDLQIRISNFIEKAKIASDQTRFTFTIAENVRIQKVLTSVQGMNVYRIIQEAVNNALKYSEASNIIVTISEENTKYKISITDDGIGFDENLVEKGNGFNTIKKRAKDLKGNASITSNPGSGTTVALTF